MRESMYESVMEARVASGRRFSSEEATDVWICCSRGAEWSYGMLLLSWPLGGVNLVWTW